MKSALWFFFINLSALAWVLAVSFVFFLWYGAVRDDEMRIELLGNDRARMRALERIQAGYADMTTKWKIVEARGRLWVAKPQTFPDSASKGR